MRICLLLSLTLLLTAGCQRTITPETPAAPPPTYHGPNFLRGTIGSVTTIRGYKPTLVSGYGLVTRLDGTGSADVPPELRQWFLDEMAKRGFGRHESGYADLTPAEVLASDTTAVVLIEGMVPPGASAGDRFDLLISALPQTQTTSLEGGLLYTTQLRVGGSQLGRPATSSIANGRGWVFLNPFQTEAADGDDTPVIRPDKIVGTIPAGGMVTRAAPLELHTNRPSYRLTKQIADRINGRFPATRTEDPTVAIAKNDTIIQIDVPETFRGDPAHLLDLIEHLYLNPTADFAQQKARELADLLNDPANHVHAQNIATAWEAMGTHVLSVIRPLYQHDAQIVRLAALTAGARVKDTRAAEPLFEIAKADLGQPSEKATVLLASLLKARPDFARVVAMLRELVDAADARVRIAAYHGLAAVNDPTVKRWPFADKLELATVQAENPMIYVTRQGVPRIIIFNDKLGFDGLQLLSLWDGRFMLRPATENPGHLALFYKAAAGARPITAQVPANLGYLVGVMAYQPDPTLEEPSPGLDMTYHEIVSVLYQLSSQGYVDAPLVLQPSDVLENVTQGRIEDAARSRPETEAEKSD